MIEVVDGAVVVEAVVGLLDTVFEVLLVRVGVVHLALLVGEEGVVVDVVGLAAAQYGAVVTYTRVGIDGKEVEVGLAAEGVDFAGGSDALDDEADRASARLIRISIFSCQTSITGEALSVTCGDSSPRGRARIKL